MPKSIARLVMSLTVLCVLAACVDLKAVSHFSAEAAEQKQFQKLVDAYVESPERQKRYQPESQYGALDSDHMKRSAQRKQLMALHTVLTDYMKAMGTLASDEVVDYGAEIKGLGTALTNAEYVSADQAKAATDLASIIARAVTDAYRQSQVSKFLQDANPHIFVVTRCLADITGKSFVEGLKNEREAVNKYYKNKTEAADREGGQAAAIALMDQQYKQRLAELDALEAAATNYAELMKKIGKGHHELTVNASNLSAAEVLGIAATYAGEIDRAKTSIDNLLDKAGQ